MVGKNDKATISSLLSEYLEPDSTKEVVNRDSITISALASKYLEDENRMEHPIGLLASLERKIMESDEEIELNAHVASLEISSGPDTQQQNEIDQHEQKLHEEIINNVTKEFDALDPYKADMFKSSINFVSEYQSEEETLEEETITSENTVFSDAVSEMDVHINDGMNSLSNTQEMYALFSQSDNKNSVHDEYTIKEDNAIDPHVASGVARMPDDIIDLLDSDDEEEEVTDIEKGISNARKNDSEEAMLLHPMDKLLQIKNNEFHHDDERLLKVMALAIQNGAPANMITLYLKGHISKSHVLNFIRTSIKNRKKLEIDVSNVDFSHGYMSSDPIDLISPTSMETNTSDNDDKKTNEMIAAATKGTSLSEDPPAELRECTLTNNEMSENKEFKPPSTESDKVHLKSFKDYRK